jgi:hypothetical protein
MSKKNYEVACYARRGFDKRQSGGFDKQGYVTNAMEFITELKNWGTATQRARSESEKGRRCCVLDLKNRRHSRCYLNGKRSRRP